MIYVCLTAGSCIQLVCKQTKRGSISTQTRSRQLYSHGNVVYRYFILIEKGLIWQGIAVNCCRKGG